MPPTTPKSVKFIFFDAGNTLVFLDFERVLAPLTARGVRVKQEQIYAAERTAKRQMDESVHMGKVDARYWETFFEHLLNAVNIDDRELMMELQKSAQRAHSWCGIRPGTADVLADLQQRFKLAVISNSDGSIRTLLGDLGLLKYFEVVVDSSLVGYEKPDPRIFRAALEATSAAPEQSLYVGDVLSVDYEGARNVGMQAILMDVAGAYAGTDLPRIESLEQIEKVLF